MPGLLGGGVVLFAGQLLGRGRGRLCACLFWRLLRFVVLLGRLLRFVFFGRAFFARTLASPYLGLRLRGLRVDRRVLLTDVDDESRTRDLLRLYNCVMATQLGERVPSDLRSRQRFRGLRALFTAQSTARQFSPVIRIPDKKPDPEGAPTLPVSPRGEARV